MADGEDRLLGLVEVADHGLHALVGADVFRTAPARAIDGIVLIQLLFRLGEGLVDVREMAEPLDIGLVALEIMQRGLDLFARLLVGADHMNRVADRLHPLLKNEDFIFLGEFPCQHQYFLAAHVSSSLFLNAGRQVRRAASVRTADAVRSGLFKGRNRAVVIHHCFSSDSLNDVVNAINHAD